MQTKLDAGEYVHDKGVDAFSKPASPSLKPEFRIALEEVQLYCAPTSAGFYDADATSKRIDRNRCSNAHPQELIQILGAWSGGMKLARTATSWGFIQGEVSLSPIVDKQTAQRFAKGPFGILREARSENIGAGAVGFKRHARLPLANAAEGRAYVASAEGVREAVLGSDALIPAARPLTRRAILSEALSYLGTPYGFGGLDGGIDCSRLLVDLFASFGLDFPRFSGWQARAGSFSYDVTGIADEAKQAIIDKADKAGVVILQLPGHIMLYLGRDEKGKAMALHALSYYLRPCEPGLDTAMVVGKVQIGGLELGRGTHKTALLERITSVTVIGGAPSAELEMLASLRPGAPTVKPSTSECRKLPSDRILVSPAQPRRGSPVRAIATSRTRLGPATISFFDSKGRRQDSSLVQTGGPPRGYIGEVAKASSTGSWMAVLGDGEQVYGCRRFSVKSPARARHKPKKLRRKRSNPDDDEVVEALPDDADEASGEVPVDEGPPIWSLRRKWSPAYEDLYATFVERLFDYPADEDLTWPDLHTILRDPSRNIFYNYNGDDEENNMKLVPDCADLPYTLRAYFSWKLRLPFGVHLCRRAREGRPPTCDVAESNLLSRSDFRTVDFDKQDRETKIFEEFVNRHVRRTVHSSSGRTGPDDDETDFYPVSLSRETLRPGTLFTDPYGHLLVVVDWIPQGFAGYGGLIGADAQPDGTIGRRRFWRGSFLFRPETDSGGAGFKAFRPWVFDRESKTLLATPNKELRRDKTARYSKEQYAGSESDFYDKMESIINPRALDPLQKMESLVDALEEQVTRRGSSVTTGEDFMKSRNFEPIDMPEGSKIFLTSGPWEDFSTPSRDWRLLIAIHTVVDFPDSVRRTPQQYGIEAGQAEKRAKELEVALMKILDLRAFPYTRSDGSKWTITLKDLVDRRVDFEMSYNPNDCPEIRWAAKAGSEEAQTCKRHAPQEQRDRMQEYRPWFSGRSRPAS
jgi:cell wall-associated NlpC family hydrolase